MKLKFICLLFIGFVTAAPYGPHGMKLTGGFFLQARYANNQVELEVTIPKFSFLGFTLGRMSMRGTDMVIFQAGKEIKVLDSYGLGYRPPTPKRSDKQDWKINGVVRSGRKMTIKASRGLKTDQEDDFSFSLDRWFKVGFAANRKSASIFRKHGKTGGFWLKIKKNGKDTFPCSVNCPVPEPIKSVFPLPSRNWQKNHGPHGIRLSRGFFLQARYANNQVELEVTIPKFSFLGFTLGKKSMKGTDMVIFQAGREINVLDSYGLGYRPPTPRRSDKQDWKVSNVVLNDRQVTIKASRALQTDQDDDFIFNLKRWFKVGFAINRRSASIFRKHGKTGHIWLRIKKNGKNSFSCSVNCPKTPKARTPFNETTTANGTLPSQNETNATSVTVSNSTETNATSANMSNSTETNATSANMSNSTETNATSANMSNSTDEILLDGKN